MLPHVTDGSWAGPDREGAQRTRAARLPPAPPAQEVAAVTS
jgi:hypothetical protein